MVCQSCGENEATVHLKEITGGDAKALHLCGACAAAQGLVCSADGKVDLSGLLKGLAAAKGESSPAADAPAASPGPAVASQMPACSGCGLTLKAFGSTGRLGCPECYRAFAEALGPALQRVHRGQSHCGKDPSAAVQSNGRDHPGRSVARLGEELARAIAAEDYEKAAELRDSIAALERSSEKAEVG